MCIRDRSEGVSIESVSKMLGHSQIKTTQVYAETSPERVFLDIEKIDVYKRQTLAMVCHRYMEHRDFTSVPYWKLTAMIDVYKRQAPFLARCGASGTPPLHFH